MAQKNHHIYDSDGQETDQLIPSHSSRYGLNNEQYSISHSPPAADVNGDVCYRGITIYKRRWYILLLFSLIAMTQNIVWNTWNTLTHSALVAFDWDLSVVALFANWGCITYVLSMPLFSWMMDVKGLRWACVITSGLVAGGCGLRCITSSISEAKWFMHAGHILNGLAGPVSMAAPSVISAVWFPSYQRTTATSLSLFSASIGMSVSFILGPNVVSFFYGIDCDNGTDINNSSTVNESDFWRIHCNETDDEKADRMRHAIMKLMYIEAMWSGLLFLLILVYFPAKPPSAPSVSAAVTRIDFLSGMKKLFRHTTFWKIGLCYAISVGICDEWMSFVDPIVHDSLEKCHSGEKSNQIITGWIGCFGNLACGISGCLISGFADKYSRHMKLLLSIFFTFSFALSIVFALDTSCIIPINRGWRIIQQFLFTGYILLAIGIETCIPLFYELACENTYPIAEGVTSGLLTWLNNAIGVIFLVILMLNIGTEWMNWTLSGSIAISLPIILLHRDNYNRLDIDSPTIAPINSSTNASRSDSRNTEQDPLRA